MKLGIRLLFVFFLINGLAIFLVLRVFTGEIKPNAREVMEDVLVDTANILAELAADDFSIDKNGKVQFKQDRFAKRVDDYARRPVDAKIWGLHKQQLDFRVYVTDDKGMVVYDSEHKNLGKDFSRWRDVKLTLAGQYGARSTMDVPKDDNTTVMHVAAPIKQGERIVGVLTVAKPNNTVMKFIERTQSNMMNQGSWLMLLSAAIGGLVTFWLVWHVRRLRQYAGQVQAGEKLAPPKAPGELGELALAMDAMRARVEQRDYIENYVRALTHELKSPVAAIRSAAELLHDDLPFADQQRFSEQISQQGQRIGLLIDRLLQLSRLEQMQGSLQTEPLRLLDCAERVLTHYAGTARLKNIDLRIDGQAAAATDNRATMLHANAELMELAMSNLLANALDFAPAGSRITIACASRGFTVQDEGAGVPDYALPRLGERFYSTARPDGSRQGTGLGLAIVRQIAQLHGAHMHCQNTQPGFRVTFSWD